MLKLQFFIKLSATLSTVFTVVFIVIYLMFRQGIFLTLSITLGTFAYHFLMRLIVGALVNAMMHNKANYKARRYRLCGFEKKLYKALRVKQWKGKMPTYDPSLFSLNLHTPSEIAGAMCQAEVVHEVIAALSFLPVLSVPFFDEFAVFFITSLLAALFDMMFVIMQRYNRERIIRLESKITSKNICKN